MKCAVPSCLGHCKRRNWLGVGDRCVGPAADYFYDDPNVSSNEPLDQSQLDALDQIHELRDPG